MLNNHLMSRYAGVTERLINAVQAAYIAGENLALHAPSMNKLEIALVLAQSYEADALLIRPDFNQLNNDELAASDWTLAVLAEFFFEQSQDARAWSLLEKALNSPYYSPMLRYNEIFLDRAQEYRLAEDYEQAVRYFHRGLAHSLRHEQAQNVLVLLAELADTYWAQGDIETGLILFTALIANNPNIVWTYNYLAQAALRSHHKTLGRKAVARSLEALAYEQDNYDFEQVDAETVAHNVVHLREQLLDLQAALSDKSETVADIAPISAGLLDRYEQALGVSFNEGEELPPALLCQKIIPGLDEVVVKRPPTMPKLPPPAAFEALTGPPQTLPGRNDPCWCGSGKKYKKCHFRADQRRIRSG